MRHKHISCQHSIQRRKAEITACLIHIFRYVRTSVKIKSKWISKHVRYARTHFIPQELTPCYRNPPTATILTTVDFKSPFVSNFTKCDICIYIYIYIYIYTRIHTEEGRCTALTFLYPRRFMCFHFSAVIISENREYEGLSTPSKPHFQWHGNSIV